MVPAAGPGWPTRPVTCAPSLRRGRARVGLPESWLRHSSSLWTASSSATGIRLRIADFDLPSTGNQETIVERRDPSSEPNDTIAAADKQLPLPR